MCRYCVAVGSSSDRGCCTQGKNQLRYHKIFPCAPTAFHFCRFKLESVAKRVRAQLCDSKAHCCWKLLPYTLLKRLFQRIVTTHWNTSLLRRKLKGWWLWSLYWCLFLKGRRYSVHNIQFTRPGYCTWTFRICLATIASAGYF